MDSEMVSSGKQEVDSSDCKIKWIQVLQVSFAMHNFPPACDGKYLVIPYQHRGALGLWNLDNLAQDPLILYGHAWSITALSLSIGKIPKLLCSCAEDWVILWNFGSSSEEPECGQSNLLPKSQAQIRSPGQVHFACFVFNDRILVLVVDREIYLYKNIAHIATFEGHLAKVTAVSGCYHQPELLISVSEDRTFMIWDTYKLSLLHKSNILTGSPIINVACDILSPQFVMGSMDGHIWIHDLSPGSQYRELASLDVAKSTGSYFSSSNHVPVDGNGYHAYDATSFLLGKQKISHDKSLPPDATFRADCDSQVEPGWAILGFHFQKPLNGHMSISDTSIHPWHEGNFSAIMSPAPTLLIGMTTAIVSLNLRTLEIDLIANLQNERDTFIEGSPEIVGLAGNVSFCPCSSQENKVWCVIKSLFTSAVYIGVINITTAPIIERYPAFSPLEMKMARMTLEESKSNTASARDGGSVVKLSLIACEPLHQASPLRSSFNKQERKVIAKKSSKELISKLTRSKSKESKVNISRSPHNYSRKSPAHSGWSTARCPKPTSSPPESSSGKPKSTTKLITKLAEGYVSCHDPPTHLTQTIRIMNQTASITSIDFSGNGKTLACATSLNSAHIVKNNGKVLNLAGHNATVNSINYNLDGSCILTASDDKTAKLWSWKNHSMVMDIQAILKSQPVLKNVADHSVKEPLFTKEIKHVQFFYMDKFILLTSGNSLYLYKYNLEPSKSNLTKFRYRGRYKLVKEFPVSAQQILNTAAINQFYSYLVLCACSDRSVRIFDMNVGSVVQQVFDVHTKPPYRICLNSGSAFAAQHPSAYNMFLTTAVGDNIKLWDLRSNRCVQRFIGNMNRAFHCGLRFSPCARYFACGSEDKSAYIFDLRGGAYVSKLSGHSDVVTDVVYKPDEPILVTATNDGVVSYFSSS